MIRLVYVSPVPLQSFAQRPHHFVEWFHRRFNAQVLWVDPGPSRLPKISDWRKIVRRRQPSLGPAWAQQSWISQLNFPVLPFEPLAWGRMINRHQRRSGLQTLDGFMTPKTWIVAGKPCALVLDLANRHPEHPLVFDVMDSMPDFSSGLSSAWMQHAEAELVNRADWILTSSTALQNRFSVHGVKVRKIMNGLSSPVDRFVKPDTTNKPPVYGYIGTMASWFDWAAVIRLAKSKPEVQIRLIGPCEAVPPSGLPQNIHLHPAIPHEAVYDAMREFSVGLIPFKINTLTDFVDPVKYYEYRAVGLPVLSTKFGEMKHRTANDGVFFLDDPTALLSSTNWTKRANAEQRLSFCQENHWDKRFDSIDFLQPLTNADSEFHRPLSKK